MIKILQVRSIHVSTDRASLSNSVSRSSTPASTELHTDMRPGAFASASSQALAQPMCTCHHRLYARSSAWWAETAGAKAFQVLAILYTPP